MEIIILKLIMKQVMEMIMEMVKVPWSGQPINTQVVVQNQQLKMEMNIGFNSYSSSSVITVPLPEKLQI